MAELTNLESKLGEVVGLAMAAQEAGQKVAKLAKDEGNEELVETLELRMGKIGSKDGRSGRPSSAFRSAAWPATPRCGCLRGHGSGERGRGALAVRIAVTRRFVPAPAV